MPHCAAFGCNFQSKGNKGTHISIHNFPQDKTRRKQWEDACGRIQLPKDPRLCSLHFTPDDFESFYHGQLLKELTGAVSYKRRLKPGAVPSIFPYRPPPRPESESEKRAKKRLRQEMLDALLDECEQTSSTVSKGSIGVQSLNKTSIETEVHTSEVEVQSKSDFTKTSENEAFMCECGETHPDLLLGKSGEPAHETSDPDRAPSLLLGHSEVSHSLERHQRSSPDPAEIPEDYSTPTLPDHQYTATLTHTTPISSTEGQECSFCLQRSAEIKRLTEENRRLRGAIRKDKMDENFLKNDDSKVKYYTGLPCFAVLMAVLAQLLPCLRADQKLSPLQMFVLTLMRLRLNLPTQHLGYLFGVGQKTVSTTFRDTVSVMFTHLSPLVHWPERHCLQATIPHQFVEVFGDLEDRVAVIVDCFEIAVERASNLKVNTYSDYKHQKTVKYLIGMTPQGAVSYISKGWAGWVSDTKVIENCGILSKLEPGDLVLAQRGLDVTDSFELLCAEVSQGRCQLDTIAVKESRRLANLRELVERLIGAVRSKYTILRNTIPLSLVVPCEGDNLVLLDKIVSVCCALSNMCPSIIVKPG